VTPRRPLIERSAATRTVAVCLTADQLKWLEKRGAEHRPTLDAEGMVAYLVERAMVASVGEDGKRAHQLEVYRASGYAEHHPDYPNVSDGFAVGRDAT